MPLTITEGKATFYAYAFIHEFFDMMGLIESKRGLDRLFFYSMETTVYDKETPAMVLFHLQQLSELIDAAYVISEGYSGKPGVVLLSTEKCLPDISDTKTFMSEHTDLSAWESFPRHLTAAQFFDPYKAIKRFCSFMSLRQWQQALIELRDHALGNDCLQIDETGLPYNLFIVRLRMMQLIEACWLIEVRQQHYSSAFRADPA